jgi:hypothetical protein
MASLDSESRSRAEVCTPALERPALFAFVSVSVSAFRLSLSPSLSIHCGAWRLVRHISLSLPLFRRIRKSESSVRRWRGLCRGLAWRAIHVHCQARPRPGTAFQCSIIAAGIRDRYIERGLRVGRRVAVTCSGRCVSLYNYHLLECTLRVSKCITQPSQS